MCTNSHVADDEVGTVFRLQSLRDTGEVCRGLSKAQPQRQRGSAFLEFFAELKSCLTGWKNLNV